MNPETADQTLIALTADIVSAHVGNNSVSQAEIGNLITTVYQSLLSLSAPVVAVAEAPTPAVSIRSSIKHEHIVCLDCGAKMKMLKRHLSTDHNLTPEGYRARWGLNQDYPLVAPAYAERRRDLAVKIGLGRKPAVKPAAAKPARAMAKKSA